jgi:hypothetical protein
VRGAVKRAGALLFLGLAAACGDKPAEPQPVARPALTSSPAGAPAGSAAPDRPAAPAAAAGDLAWDAPASFTKVEHASPMRKATYHAPKVDPDTEAPELSVTVVGGSIDANIDRWIGQFDAAAKDTMARSTRQVSGRDVTIVELKGTFAGGGMMGGPSTPKPGFALLAAIIPAGERSWFFKMTGPEASVTAARADFDALVASIRPAG